MEQRANIKQFEYKGRKFEVRKMDAMESVAVLKELLTKTLPIDLLSILGSAADTGKIFGKISSTRSEMDIDEFIKLQKRILKYSFEILPSGYVAVITPNGFYGVNDIETDITLVMQLLFESVRLNYESFFIETLQSLGVLEEVDKVMEKLDSEKKY